MCKIAGDGKYTVMENIVKIRSSRVDTHNVSREKPDIITVFSPKNHEVQAENSD